MALLAGAIFLSANSKPFNDHAANGFVTPEKIIQYLRERFGVPAAVKMTVGPFRDSFDPHFREATVAVDDGKQKKNQNILVSKDGRYLIVGNAFSLGADPKSEIVQYVRDQFKLPPTTQLAVGESRKSAFPGFNETTITVDDGKKKQSQNFYVSSDNRAFVLGSIFNFSIDPKHEVLKAITTRNQPATGPASAPVTLVEFADLECPTCARLQEFLEKDLLPKYGDKVRVIFKEFPLPSHDWSMTAAIASQCAYQNDPGNFVAYRSLIFKNQSSINATNARDMLLNLAAQAGIDSLKLAACVDSKASLARVEQNMHEGQRVGVVSTPTTYINGVPVVGAGPAENFYNAIDEVLRTSK
jgi:protein-disulfide isomerase